MAKMFISMRRTSSQQKKSENLKIESLKIAFFVTSKKKFFEFLNFDFRFKIKISYIVIIKNKFFFEFLSFTRLVKKYVVTVSKKKNFNFFLEKNSACS